MTPGIAIGAAVHGTPIPPPPQPVVSHDVGTQDRSAQLVANLEEMMKQVPQVARLLAKRKQEAVVASGEQSAEKDAIANHPAVQDLQRRIGNMEGQMSEVNRSMTSMQ